MYATTNTLVSFADHSNVTWGLGKLIVKGFKDKSLRFGTNASGLPQNLLDKVFVGGGKVVIDSLGYLHRDQDGDGVRDTEDQCPNTPPGEQVDANGPNAGCSDSQKDSDGDGVGDNSDIFPLDATQQNDTDGDTYGDEEFGNAGDSCPTVFGNSTIDRYGCLDSDGYGWNEEGDDFPLDPTDYQD